MKTKNERFSYAGQGEGFWGAQVRFIIGVNVFTLLLSIGLHLPYDSERFFFGLTHPVTTTITLALVLTAGFLLPIWLAQWSSWMVARRREYVTYFVSPATAERINPKKLLPFVLRLRFNSNSLIAGLYLPEALDAPNSMPSVTIVYFAYLLLMMGLIMFVPARTSLDEVLFFFVRSGAVAAFMGAWGHYRQSRSRFEDERV